jgi:excisionase family DNA binding protein
MKQSYTSGEAARLCGLGLTTLKRWISRGALKSYRTPGGDLRILHRNLVDFMRDYDIPMHYLDEEPERNVLIHIKTPEWRDKILVAIELWEGVLKPVVVEDDLEFGHFVGALRPAYIIVEPDRGTDVPGRCRAIRRLTVPDPVRIALLVPEEELAYRQGEDRPEVVFVPESEEGWAELCIHDLAGDIGAGERRGGRKAG